MRLRKAEAGEAAHLLEDPLGELPLDPPLDRAGDEALAVGVQRRLRAAAAHRPPQPLGLARGEPGHRHRHLDHLVLEDDRPERVGEDRLQARMLVGHLVAGVLAQQPAALEVGMHGAALDRPRAHQRHLDDHVVERLRQAARQHLHLGAALDLKHAGGLRRPDRLERRLVVERDPRQVDALSARRGDRLDAALDRREHPEPEQVDLEKARVRARVLVPLDDLAPFHRGRLHRADVDQRPGREHHPPRVLGEVTRQPPGLAGQPRQAAPARRRGPRRTDRLGDVALHLVAARVHVGDLGDALDLARRQAERLGEVANRAARAIAGEGGDQRRPLAAVAIVDARDQLLADVTREVEVDVGHLGDVVVEEAPQEQPGLDRVDMREAGQIADDRAHARAPASPGRQQVARRVGAADLGRDLPRQLEQVEVQEEEPREPEPADHPQLLLEPPLGLGPLGGARVAELEPSAADLGQGAVGLEVLGARVAVAELGGEVEAQPLRQPLGLGDRLRMLGEARRHRRRRGEHGAGVAAALGLALLEHRVGADGDQGILELGPGAVVGVDVAGRHAGDPEPLGDPGEPAVAGPVAPPQRPLQLDPQALAAEGGDQTPRPGTRRGAARRVPRRRRWRRRERSPRGRRGPRFAPAASSGRGRGGGDRDRAAAWSANAPRSAAGRGCASRRPTRPAR